MRMMFLGAPGAGKGTQAEIISNLYSVPTISTGDMIRSAIKLGTEMGKNAKAYIDRGQLVPDEVVIGIVKDRIAQDDCANGFILDGFPRTIAQADALETLQVRLDLVIDLVVDDQVIIKRMGGRRVCPDCGATYHAVNIPSKDGIHCDKCGGVLAARKDDAPEIVAERLEVYHKQTAPLEEYYRKRNLLTEIPGDIGMENVTAEIRKAIAKVAEK